MGSMEPLHEALIKRMERFGLEKAMSATFIIEAANRVLPEHARAKTFSNGALTVELATPAEAYFFKQEIDSYIEQINAALSEPQVEKIRIRTHH